ncbi:fidgetin-like protein 1 [Tripterygium wilfordii]|uniref:Fidgetin-like protein 1 n=1 Tax=Tripterygium wilfordii TaxID=458696 RepID=A0A7J7DL20_TRIWF|nr:ATPase family AAA domain-containing protein FIGL1-like [Tripterygium wilfordii]XP_038703754.1 ATPase family AAA domain-containing protein FIGL1-like [Tripterygium wilfordii]KAF5746934.1 fidgetin-like protein 1 [Tripterygium wilfordii]
MAGKRKAAKNKGTNCFVFEAPNKAKMEKEGRCWRKEVDEKLKRLHSLHFGADLALERGDYETAHTLGLTLLGFIDSTSLTHADDSFTRHIRLDAASKVDQARRALAPDSDRRAFEHADRAPGTTFRMKGEIDIEKIKQSKYYCAHLLQSNGRPINELGSQWDEHKNLSSTASKAVTQATLTSLYGNNILRAKSISHKSSLNGQISNSEDCMIIEKAPSYNHNPKSHGVSTSIKVEEEGGHINTLGMKRVYVEISSPKSDNPNSPSNNEESNNDVSGNGFVTARAKLEMDARQRRGLTGSPSSSISPQSENTNRAYGARTYGVSRRGIRGNFVPPIKSNGGNAGNMTSRIGGTSGDGLDDSTRRCLELLCGPEGELPERLRNLEPRLIEHVSNEIMDQDPNVRWDDIAGLDHAKKCVTEMVIWPLLRPDIFKGCRSPGRGLLLFGPPGTGKTMIGKAIAGEAKATFFYISASSLTSKWIGEGEKLVRALFGVASCRQPAVIFVDEIDSLLSQRKSEGEHDSSRRLKTQFFIEMEGFGSGNEQILLIGATNRPQELDDAARRRLAKRLYIPLPSFEARAWIIHNLLEKDGLFKLSKEEIDTICKWTEGYSGSDMKNLVKDASMGPLREALKQGIEITKLEKEDMRPVTLQDFKHALQEVRPSVSLNELVTYEDWNKQFGSLAL